VIRTRTGFLVAAVIGLTQLVGFVWLFVRTETLVAVFVAGSVGLLTAAHLFYIRREPRRAGMIGGALAIFTGFSLLLMALPTDPAVILILGPPIFAGIIALLNPDNRWALGGAMLLISGGAYLILIAGAGLVYVPAVIALAYALLNSDVTREGELRSPPRVRRRPAPRSSS
jgi:hypothetical protein